MENEQLQPTLDSTGTESNELGRVDEAAKVEEKVEEKPLPMMPLFIGCADKEMVDKLIAIVDTTKYEPALLSPEVLHASTQNWFFSQLKKEDQKRITDQRKNEDLRKAALKYVTEINKYFLPHEGFRIYELKNYYNNLRNEASGKTLPNVSVSNKQVDELVDLMMLFGYLMPTIPEVNRHKQVFRTTIDPVSRMEQLQELDASYAQREAELSYERQAIADEVAKLSAEILQGDKLDNDAEPEAKAKPKRKPRKKKVVDTGEQHAPTDAVNE